VSGQLLRRYRDALIGDAAPPRGPRSWDGYTLWQRYWTGLLGFRLAPGNPGRPVPVEAKSRLGMPAPGGLRLPRFDRAALRTAGTGAGRGLRLDTVNGGVLYVQRDAGRDRLEILVESASEEASTAVLPVAVVTPEQAADYLLMIFRHESGKWVAAVQVPGVQDWADVFVQAMRERASLGSSDSEVVARSVRFATDPWVEEWRGVARERAVGDPVRDAIEEASGS
jgi:hypothetical protein